MNTVNTIHQTAITLRARAKGFHLVTDEILEQIPEIESIRTGLLHVFIQHTSASLAINENADPSVRTDLTRHFDELAPENQPYYTHTSEGPDDMPAHIKSTLTGCDLTIPIRGGRLALGTWQGIYLCEHRDRGGARKVILTITGHAD
ncbi:MAG: hypothetical protein CL946_11050 [Ectothiorhodospiraceae bacterium]|nr:hypothetical protein [Ectothiorhodospiraceae bacterium]